MPQQNVYLPNQKWEHAREEVKENYDGNWSAYIQDLIGDDMEGSP